VSCARDSQVKGLEQKVTALEDALETLKTEYEVLKTRVEINETGDIFEPAHPKSASFKPDEKGFQAIYTDYGQFLVSLQEIRPYANGYKVKFNLGNPSSLDFENVEVGLQWGPSRPENGFGPKSISYTDWRKKFKTSKQSVNRRLFAGSWNPVELVLAPASQDDLGSIEITSIAAPRVFLASR
jgi:hypothetical protein